jgi:cation:H+ antiporter
VKNAAALKSWLLIAALAALSTPAIVFRALDDFAGVVVIEGNVERVLLFGGAIVAAAFLLTWASETAEKDISQGLALAAIALIAVLPEYAVDLYFAWTAPTTPDHAHFATANMTGANRLLVGLGWPTVFFLFWLRSKKRVLHVSGHDTSLGIIFLGAATLYSFVLPLKGNLSLIDTGVLVSLFAAYVYLVSRAPAEEPELVGPAQTIGALPDLPRRMVVIAMFLYSAAAIFASAEPFANGLVDTGRQLGIDEYLLVQWLAPLASEAPEFTVAAILALRGRALAAMAMLISSKVNQWTLLIGTLPLAYSISGTTLSPLVMNSRQVEEVFLTAAQSAFAITVFVSMSISFREAALLAGLFSTQLLSPLVFSDDIDIWVRYGYGATYLLLAVVTLFQDRGTIPIVFREARQLSGSERALSTNPRGRPRAGGRTKKPG